MCSTVLNYMIQKRMNILGGHSQFVRVDSSISKSCTFGLHSEVPKKEMERGGEGDVVSGVEIFR